MPSVQTRLANADDVEAIASLFDGYRQFYGQSSDLGGASAFVAERLERGDSVIIVAEIDGQQVGFAQLYPSFTSVGMTRIMILNDLFVAVDHRRAGAGQALLAAAAEWSRHAGAIRMTLSTQNGNIAARQVYDRIGWVRDDEFVIYKFELTD